MNQNYQTAVIERNGISLEFIMLQAIGPGFNHTRMQHFQVI